MIEVSHLSECFYEGLDIKIVVVSQPIVKCGHLSSRNVCTLARFLIFEGERVLNILVSNINLYKLVVQGIAVCWDCQTTRREPGFLQCAVIGFDQFVVASARTEVV